MTLSKSQYIRGLQCYKSLWLYKHQPELRQKPDVQTESLFETGCEVGDLAKELFPNGIEITFNSDNFNGMIAKTKELIESGAEVIYEATFMEDGIFAMADILVRNGNIWDIYEVKASTYVKEYYLDDISIQWYTITKVLDLGRAYIVHINNKYVRTGDLSIRELLKREDMTDIVLERQEEIPQKLHEMEEILKGNEPHIDIGPHCFNPFECDFVPFCWRHIPQKNSVFDLSYARGKQWDLYRQGVLSIEEIPDDFYLGVNTALQVKHHKSGEVKIDKEKISEFLDTIVYPINFFDFETFQEAVPRFDNQRPYEKIPFQYSLHILHEDGILEHKEFLGDENSDPRELLSQQILQDIASTGSIVAFSQSFEITQIKNLAQANPNLSDALLALIDRFVDLAYPFQHKYYYHPGFNGRYSIKVVLPTLFPDNDELDYKKLGSVQNGSDAMNTFAKLHLLKDKNKREEIRKDLLAYCRLDTLAMVRIWEKLRDAVNENA
ncbi:DUF2779 domain-containing protein [Sulfurovum sp. NBC37-1]|uniref:DUF2779 domain-containing protein n=1 Tax=Sulfurovum sp. (strain NBC37-1) TaxID=387093 RepID=UPI000158797F|nr:DUF2779 domain-containing protein [Sulfurovum sp. NBC37-1]BAF73238.1 conserved hypothetical protein [Sulfurovum sp. NBC37-1]